MALTLLAASSLSTSQWVFAALAVLVIGVSKAGFGGGVAILAVPLMAVAMPTNMVLGVMLPLLILADIFSNLHHLGNQSWHHLRWMLPGALLGVAAGSALLVWLQNTTQFDAILNLTVGGICLGFVVLQLYRMIGGRVPHVPAHPIVGSAAGLFAGTVSTLAHSAGPVVSLYLLEQKLNKRLLTGTMLAFFLVVNLAKLPTYLWRGIITTDSLAVSAWLVLLVPVGTFSGVWLHKRIAERPFVAIMYLGAAVAAVRMIYKGLV